jgi:hypothetical protein
MLQHLTKVNGTKKWLNNIIFCYRLIYNKNLYQFQQKLQTIITTNHMFLANGKNGQYYFVYYILIETKNNYYFNKKKVYNIKINYWLTTKITNYKNL